MPLLKPGALPARCFRATYRPCSFQSDIRKHGKHYAKPYRNTHTLHLLTTGCHAIITHKAFKDGTWAILSFTNDPRHSWWQSNNHPARTQTFKHLNFAVMKSEKLMSWITMKTHSFSFFTSSLCWGWKPESLDYTKKVIYCREGIALYCPQMTTDHRSALHNSSHPGNNKTQLYTLEYIYSICHLIFFTTSLKTHWFLSLTFRRVWNGHYTLAPSALEPETS